MNCSSVFSGEKPVNSLLNQLIYFVLSTSSNRTHKAE
jgi:hypothetical protein